MNNHFYSDDSHDQKPMMYANNDPAMVPSSFQPQQPSFTRQESYSLDTIAELVDMDRQRQEDNMCDEMTDHLFAGNMVSEGTWMSYLEQLIQTAEEMASYQAILNDFDPDELDPIQDEHIKQIKAQTGQYDAFQHYEEQRHVARPDSRATDDQPVMPAQQLFAERTRRISIKKEDEDMVPDVQQPSTSSGHYNTRPRATRPSTAFVVEADEPSTSSINYKPKTQARKYSLKPEEVKKTKGYQVKRAKNNDAVRRSRNKAKEQQQLRDQELEDLKQHNADLIAELSLRNDELALKESEIAELKRMLNQSKF